MCIQATVNCAEKTLLIKAYSNLVPRWGIDITFVVCIIFLDMSGIVIIELFVLCYSIDISGDCPSSPDTPPHPPPSTPLSVFSSNGSPTYSPVCFAKAISPPLNNHINCTFNAVIGPPGRFNKSKNISKLSCSMWKGIDGKLYLV